jgi:hypothetical protein
LGRGRRPSALPGHSKAEPFIQMTRSASSAGPGSIRRGASAAAARCAGPSARSCRVHARFLRHAIWPRTSPLDGRGSRSWPPLRVMNIGLRRSSPGADVRAPVGASPLSSARPKRVSLWPRALPRALASLGPWSRGRVRRWLAPRGRTLGGRLELRVGVRDGRRQCHWTASGRSPHVSVSP